MPRQIIGDLLTAENIEKQARSDDYRMTVATLLPAKELKEFDFDAAKVSEVLMSGLAAGVVLDQQRNPVPTGGTGVGKTHLAISIA